MKINIGILFRITAALVAAVSLVSCSLLKVAVSTGEPLSKNDIDTRMVTRGFYYDFSREVAHTADSIASSSAPLAVRVGAVKWKIRATRSAVQAAMQSVPDVALCDTWILCQRMDEGFRNTPDSLLFGAYSDLARGTAARLAAQIERLARKNLSSERFGLMKEFIAEFRNAHPSDNDMENANTTLAWVEFLRARGIEAQYNTGTIAEVLSDVNDRMGSQARQVVNSVGWSKDIFKMQMEQDSLRSELGAQIDSLERHFSRIVVAAEHLPEISDKALAEFDKQVGVVLEAMNASMNAAFADLSRQRSELQYYITRERTELIDQAKNSVDEVVQSALDAVPGMIGKILLFLVLGIGVLVGGPFALGFWLGGVRQRARERKKEKQDGGAA